MARATLRTRLRRLAHENPSLRTPIYNLLKQAYDKYPPVIQDLVSKLKRIPGVKDVYVGDTWKDGYYQLRVVLKPQPGKTPWGGVTRDGTFEIAPTARGGFTTVYNFPDYRKIMRAIRSLVKRSGLHVEGVAGIRKIYEYQDAYARRRGEPRRGGYEDDEIVLELYV